MTIRHGSLRVALLGLAACLPVLPAPALAQGAAPQPIAQVLPNPADFALAATRLAQAVDNGAAGEVWDAASPVLRGLVPRAQFVQTAAERKGTLGALQNRAWRSILRASVPQPEGQLPAGEYITVNLVALGLNQQTVLQTVSFYLDSDQNWRLVGLNMQ